MLLGLNTICDVYFTGSLEVMVERWNIKPDVAGATFMAAGGSAPELCTSFIGTLVVKNDVGFGTIVGSAVFNVLFVIGLCGFLSSGEIKLTWWPLLRDCTYYLLGLGLLAIFASDGTIVLWEAIVLFAAYILYCAMMYNNARLEVLFDTEFQRAKRAASPGLPFNSVHPQCPSRPSAFAGPVQRVVGAWEAPLDKTQFPSHGSFDLASSVEENSVLGTARSLKTTTPAQTPISNAMPTQTCPEELPLSPRAQTSEAPDDQGRGERTSTWPPRTVTRHGSGAQVSGKMRGAYVLGHVVAERHEIRMASLGSKSGAASITSVHGDSMSEDSCLKTHPGSPNPAMSEGEEEESEAEKAAEEEMQRHTKEIGLVYASTGFCAHEENAPLPSIAEPDESGLAEEDKGEKEEAAERGGEEKAAEEEEDDDLMQCPEGTLSRILWFLSLPIYVPVYYLTVQPSERWFLVTFLQSLAWISGFNFLLVWWVEILGEVLQIHTIVMSFTLLAAGTSIPDLVSSVAVAKMGEGDMAISSSIGSNIFDILVGLPIPWIIKTGIVEGGSTVNIISPFLTFHVLLLLAMVFTVVLSIHCLGWKLNKTLGLIMALLYVVFLSVAITIEVIDPPPTALMF